MSVGCPSEHAAHLTDRKTAPIQQTALDERQIRDNTSEHTLSAPYSRNISAIFAVYITDSSSLKKELYLECLIQTGPGILVVK
jgi:hypothetical protein